MTPVMLVFLALLSRAEAASAAPRLSVERMSAAVRGFASAPATKAVLLVDSVMTLRSGAYADPAQLAPLASALSLTLDELSARAEASTAGGEAEAELLLRLEILSTGAFSGLASPAALDRARAAAAALRRRLPEALAQRVTHRTEAILRGLAAAGAVAEEEAPMPAEPRSIRPSLSVSRPQAQAAKPAIAAAPREVRPLDAPRRRPLRGWKRGVAAAALGTVLLTALFTAGMAVFFASGEGAIALYAGSLAVMFAAFAGLNKIL